MAVFGPKLRRFGRAPPDLAPPPRAATGEFLAQNLDLTRPPPRLEDGYMGERSEALGRSNGQNGKETCCCCCLSLAKFKGVPRAKKIIFSKVVSRPLGMLKQVFLGCFEPVVARFGPWKIPKCLENGPFWDQQWVKNGSKTRFSKNDPGPFMMLKQVVLAHFEPVATGFGSWKIPKCLENGPFWEPKLVQKWAKNAIFQK